MIIMRLFSIKQHVSKSTPFLLLRNANATSYSYSCILLSSSPDVSSSPPHPPPSNVTAKDVVASFKDWFKSPDAALLDRIFTILSSPNHAATDDASSRHAADLALSNLNLRLSESFVLDVLSYGRSASKDVLSCLKFFDWAGRQRGFYHTRATIHAIFKILSRAKLMSLMLEFLKDFTVNRYVHKVRFYDTLVLGYALAGKPGMALQLFGRMRFQGIDLDSFSYNVLLNALVEESCFDAFDMIAKQISLRGLEDDITHSLLVKRWCKQNKLDKAETHLRCFMKSRNSVDLRAVSIIVDALCKRKRFKRAATLLEELAQLNVQMDQAYGIWLQNLVQRGKVEGALQLVDRKKLLENAPPLFRFNILVLRLLMQNRLKDVCDLLIEMEKNGISPDKLTMNAILCFFCKAGMVDVAVELYNTRSEFGLSLNSMAYNYLINILCSNGDIHDAYCVLRNSMEEGYFPGPKTFSLLVDTLCREGKIDKVKELLIFSLGRKFIPSYSVCDMVIAALCKANRVDDGYLIHGELSRLNNRRARYTYIHLINGFCKLNRGDIAATLLLEMQEKGHRPHKKYKKLFRAVISCLCHTHCPENQFFKLLEMQLSRFEPSVGIFHFFIDGAAHAKRPDLAREVFEIMPKSGIKPDLKAEILMLHSYIMNDRISEALNFFNYVRQRRIIGKKIYNAMVVGLCRAHKADYALVFMREMRNNNVFPPMDCYEFLIQLLCRMRNYGLVVDLVNDLEKTRGKVSSFIGNVLLSHSFETKDLYEAWIRLREVQDETASNMSLLGQLIGTFSGCIELNQDIESLEEIIEQCFPLDIVTYNTLLSKLSAREVDLAFEMYDWICHRGYKPNQWTYKIIIDALLRKGRRAEAQAWQEKMFRSGFDLNNKSNGFFVKPKPRYLL